MRHRARSHNKPGYIIVTGLVVLAVMLTLTAIMLTLFQIDYHRAASAERSKSALFLAEAGIEKAIAELNTNPSYAGETGTALADGVFSVTITGTNSTRTIEATGYIPDATNPKSTRTVQVEADLTDQLIGFHYGLQVDGGGLTMGNNAGVIGNVYSNGSINGSSGATISGDTIVAGGINENPSLEWSSGSPVDQFFATTNPNRDIAQSFIANDSGGLTKVSLLLRKVGAPSSNLTLHLAADSNGRPSTSSLASVSIPASSVAANSGWVNAAFTSTPTVQNSTKYWLVLDYGSSNATNYWSWLKEDGYANNDGATTSSWSSGNPSWTSVGGDLNFKVWIGGTSNSINNVAIGSSTEGTARANQFNNVTVRGQNCPNPHCQIDNPSREELPINDGHIQTWKDYAASGGSIGTQSVTNGSTFNLGPKKIEGDLTLANNTTLNMTGAIWVTGNVNLSNNCQVKLDPAYNGLSGTLIVDGTITISQNCIFQNNSSLAGYILLLTTRDAQEQTSMTIQNNSAGVIYYAARSRIHFSQNASAKEVTAWGITLENNATVEYESGLANSSFTSGPGAGWNIRAGSWREKN